MPHLFDLRGESCEKANKVNTLYINIHAKFCSVSKYGSGDTDKRLCFIAQFIYTIFV